MSAGPERGHFRNPMDAESLRRRLVLDDMDNPIYRLAVWAAGHQSAFTVDKLSWKLKAVLPELIARLAAEVEEENDDEWQTEQLNRRSRV